MKRSVNPRKVGIIGCGFVGASVAFTLMQSGLFSEMVLIDSDRQKAEGEAMDISHGIPFSKPIDIYAGSYRDIADASILILTAGAGQKQGETRLDLVQKNVKIFEQILPQITQQGFSGILLVVSNPVDILTLTAWKLSGLPKHRVIGSGTVLDTARLKYELGRHLAVDSRSVHAFIIGEHGDSEIAVWSSTNVSGVPLSQFCEMRGHYQHETATRAIADRVKNSAYTIIERKQATYYGIAMSVKRICEVIVRDEKSILPVSSVLEGEYGMKGVALSIPTIVGAEGIETKIPISLSREEEASLFASAQTLREVLQSVPLFQDEEEA